MPMVFIGVLLLLAKMADFGPTAAWSWWIVLSPFAAATIWWAIADSTGITQRRAMRKMDERKAARREKAMESLGLDHKRARQVEATRAAAQRRATTMSASTEAASPSDPNRREPRP